MNNIPNPKCPECGCLRYREENLKCPECGCIIVGIDDVRHGRSWISRDVYSPLLEMKLNLLRFARSKTVALGVSEKAEKEFERRLVFFIERTVPLLKEEENAELCASVLYYLAEKKVCEFDFEIARISSIFNVSEERMASNYKLLCDLFREKN